MINIPPPIKCRSCGFTHITFGYDEATRSPSMAIDTREKCFDIGLNHDKSKGTLRCPCGTLTDLSPVQLFHFLTVGGQ